MAAMLVYFITNETIVLYSGIICSFSFSESHIPLIRASHIKGISLIWASHIKGISLIWEHILEIHNFSVTI